jgi:hypothetical protein
VLLEHFQQGLGVAEVAGSLRSAWREEDDWRLLDNAADFAEPYLLLLLKSSPVELGLLHQRVQHHPDVFGLEPSEHLLQGVSEEHCGDEFNREGLKGIGMGLSRGCQVDYVFELSEKRKRGGQVLFEPHGLLAPLGEEDEHYQFAEVEVEGLLQVHSREQLGEGHELNYK